MSGPNGKRMNVLHVISDQHNASCMGVEGHPHALTPHMDRLARSGVRFTRAYTQNPICTPSRVSIFSGQYCHNHGHYGLSGPTPPNLPGFLGHFRDHGYRTAGIGKLHVPDDPESWLDHQCDLVADCYYTGRGEEGRSPYYAYLERLGLRDREDSIGIPEMPGLQQHEARPSNLPFEHCVEGWCVSEAVRFMDECGDRPFCMQVSLPRPHQCYTPDRRFWNLYPDDLPLPDTLHQDPTGRPPHFENTVRWCRTFTEEKHWFLEPRTFEAGTRRVWRGYLACVTQVDHALGLLLDHLDRTGRADRTIVIYNSDHGAYSTTFGVPEKAPGICSEAVCRVPMIWRVPGYTRQGHTCAQFVENVDLASTLPQLCGLPPMKTTDGCDIAPLLRGDDEPVREVAVTENVWSKALRWERWRFVHYQPETFHGFRAADGTVLDSEADIGELYDLAVDPLETHNLYHDPAHQDVVHRCRRTLLEWLIRTTRIVSLWPAPQTSPIRYPTAGDGRESNAAGAKLRQSRGEIWYV